MKRIVVISILLLLALEANAQRVTGQVALSYQCRFRTVGDESPVLSLWGAHGGAQFEPFYPWPIYLETGLGAVMITAKDGARAYRLELPLDLTWQWEPSPKFSMGPYAGAYITYGFWKSYVYDGIAHPNLFNWGLMGGLSIRPGVFLINVGYYRDMMPFDRDTPGQGAFRFGNGIRVTLGVCF